MTPHSVTMTQCSVSSECTLSRSCLRLSIGVNRCHSPTYMQHMCDAQLIVSCFVVGNLCCIIGYLETSREYLNLQTFKPNDSTITGNSMKLSHQSFKPMNDARGASIHPESFESAIPELVCPVVPFFYRYLLDFSDLI